MAQFRYLILACLLAAAAGCTHVQLCSDTVNEAYTVSDLEQQQVVNNLAMFVYDYNSLPFFSFPNQGAASVTDQANAGGSAGWGRPITTGTAKHLGDFLLSALGLSAAAQRTQQEAFTLTPVNDPRKLELMRCAYQIAVSNCGIGQPSRHCPDCQARFNTFYTGDRDGSISQQNTGTITSECLKSGCWLGTGCEKDVPKECPCTWVGHYCGVYVWVLPCGRDEFTKLTLAILDYAMHEPPVRLTKDVTYNIDELGLPTNKNDAVGTVKATVAINERPESLLSMPSADQLRLKDEVEGRIKRIDSRLNELQAAAKPAGGQAKPEPLNAEEIKQLVDSREVLYQKLFFLTEQLRSGGIKEEFYPGSVAPAMPFFGLPSQLQQNTLAPTGIPSSP